ncbi:polyprenyl synthetase family protein [Paenibacillus sp. CAU 1782]
MEEFKARIADSMMELTRRWLSDGPLRSYTEAFIQEKTKEPMVFGELAIHHYYMFGGREGSEVETAAAIELAILACDILDDLEDGDAPSKLWMNTPPPHALHVATSLLAMAPSALAASVEDESAGARLASMMNRQLLHSAEGQMVDLVDHINDEASYLDMVSRKSAPLFIMSCMAGVLATGRQWDDGVALYARELGIASQIKNDVRDLLRWDEKSDFLRRKGSLPMLWLLENAGEEYSWIADYYAGRVSMDAVLDKKSQFEEACETSGAILYASVLGRLHYNRFYSLVEKIDAEELWKHKLLQRFS